MLTITTMKIKHNIKRNGRKLEGYILETYFEDWEKRWDRKDFHSSDWNFSLKSADFPELYFLTLFVFWKEEEKDNELVSYTYDTEQEAQRILDYINEFSIDVESDLYVNDNKMQIYITENWNLAKVQGEWTFYYLISSGYIYPKRDGERAVENLEPVENLEEQVQEKIRKNINTFKELFNVKEEDKEKNSNKILVTLDGNKTNWFVSRDEASRIFSIINEKTSKNVEVVTQQEDVFIYAWGKIIKNIKGGGKYIISSRWFLNFQEDGDSWVSNTSIIIIEKMIKEQSIEISKNVEVDFWELIDFINSLEMYNLE